jgi:hypothetical protein
MIYEAQISTLIQKGGHPRELHDTVSTTSIEESEPNSAEESDSDSYRFERRLNE